MCNNFIWALLALVHASVHVANYSSVACAGNEVAFEEETGTACIEVDSKLYNEIVETVKKALPGLSESTIDSNIDFATRARQTYPVAAQVPLDKWAQYVVPPTNLDERLVNWRPMFWEKVHTMMDSNPDMKKSTDIKDVAYFLNTHIWSGPFGKEIKFKGDQTPQIMDPTETLDHGYASCTGISIFMVNALRTVGIPARVVGTPSWEGDQSKGNHNWVEMYDAPTKKWIFFEGLPGGERSRGAMLDECQNWFCKPSYFSPDKKTRVYAADVLGNETFPLAWNEENKNVKAMDVTENYYNVCPKCYQNLRRATDGPQAQATETPKVKPLPKEADPTM